MEEEFSSLENKIIEYREEKGYTIEETLKILNIKRKDFNKIVAQLKEKNIYDEEKIRKSIKRRKNKEKSKDKKKLSSEESDYRRLCLDYMCKKYFHYDKTKNFNTVLAKKISELNQFFSYKVIFNTIKSQQKSLDYANSKFGTNSSEFQKISYMMAIVKNNLKNISDKMEYQENMAKSLQKEDIKNKIVTELNRKIDTKPTERIDMSNFLD